MSAWYSAELTHLAADRALHENLHEHAEADEATWQGLQDQTLAGDAWIREAFFREADRPRAGRVG